MNPKYVAPKEALRRLTFARGLNTSVYIYAATGYGKTRLVKEYLENESHIWLSACDEAWDLSILDSNKSSKMIIVVDDIQFLRDQARKDILLSLATKSNIWMVLIGRMSSLDWMIPLIASGSLMVISEENLELRPEEIFQMIEIDHIPLDECDAAHIAEETKGNPYLAVSILNMVKSGEKLTNNLKKQIGEAFVANLENNVIPQWSRSLQEFLMQVSVVDDFTMDLAIMITGDDQASEFIEEAKRIGNFIEQKGPVFKIRPMLVYTLRKKAIKEYGMQRYNRYVSNAARYHEIHGDELYALKLYEQIKDQESIRSLLIHNGRKHPGAGHYYELKNYYTELDDADIESSPVLMNAMCLLYSIILNPEKSEYWYSKLLEYGKNCKGVEKREVTEFLLFLDLALPHRGNKKMIPILKKSMYLMTNGGIHLPELSITNNEPSTMNGGKDFCNWSKKDTLLAKTIGKMLEKVLGDFGRGLVHAGLCESYYEKGEKSSEIAHLAMLTQMEIEGGGKLEILFAVVGIQIRLHVINGNIKNALQLLDTFEEKVRKNNATPLLKNIDALRARLALISGEMEIVTHWMKTSPDESVDFCTLERYKYMTKCLIYLDQGMNFEAISLLEKMKYFANMSHRTYIHMESNLLLSIAYQREKMEWKPLFIDTLNEIKEYSFIRIISEKGAGILPLLKEIRKDYLLEKKADLKWMSDVIEETTKFAEKYPSYLTCDFASIADFSEVQLSVLRYQSEGLSIKEIADKLSMSERSIKYHAAENYKKLGAKGKTDAVQIAKSLKLL